MFCLSYSVNCNDSFCRVGVSVSVIVCVFDSVMFVV